MNPGRLILPAIRWRDDTGFAHESQSIDAALAFGAGGFIVFGGRPDAVARLTTELRQRAGRELLLAADLERGAGQQFPGLTEFPPPAALAALGSPDDLATAACCTALEARQLGLNWVLAPVADLDLEPENPIVQTRAFGADPSRVAAEVAGWVRACQEGGALACVKHFPGHGRATRDSHDDLPTIAADLPTLEATDLQPFRAAIAAGVATVMTGHLRVPALDPSGAPATFAKPILAYLRDQLGFHGLIMTDALMMGAAVKDAAVNPAVRALAAGCDVLCYPADPVAAHEAILEAMKSGLLSRNRIEESLNRYHVALQRVENLPNAPPLHIMERGTGGEVKVAVAELSWLAEARAFSRAIADRLLAQGLVRGTAPRLRAPIELLVVDDDQGGAWPASPNGYVEAALRGAGIPIGPGGSRVVLAFAEPRASKGRAGFGPTSLAALGAAENADLVLLFAHPRLARQVPGSSALVVAWHRQRLMQEAAARWLAERTR